MTWRRISPLAVCFITCLAIPSFAQPPKTPEKEEETVTLEAFIVTGSYIKRTDFEGPSPIRVITRKEIDRVAGTGLADILNDISEATNFTINEHTASAGTRGVAALDLRSLGTGNTLILLDGRRQAPNGIAADGAVFVDLNRFPVGMIERVEILKDGASAVYGADATAGVVNIILRKNFSGTEVSARYGNYFRTDGAETSWSLLHGGAKGRARALLGLTYSTRNAIAASDLPLTASADQTEIWRAIDPVKYADKLLPTALGVSFFDFRSTAGPYATIGVPTLGHLAHPSNGLTAAAILNPLTGITSTFLPGTGGVPQGTLGRTPNLASVPFTNNSGRPTAAQFEPRRFVPGDIGNRFNFQPFVWNTSETERTGVSADLGFKVSATLDLYATLSWVRLETETRLAPSPLATAFDNSILVPANNFYNPFGIPVLFFYRSVEVGSRRAQIDSESITAVLGARGVIENRFEWDLGWSFSNNESSDLTRNSLSEAKVREALARTTPNALNIFGGPDFKNDPATIEGLKIISGRSGNASTALADFRVTTRELATLPWGAVGGSAGLEHRLERFNVTNDVHSSVLDDLIGSGRTAGPTHSKRDVQSVAAELRIPLVPTEQWKLLRTVELSIAARFEKFSDGYDSGIKPFVGLRLRPTDKILLRASYGKVFRSPTLPQLYGGTIEQFAAGFADLRRPSELTGDSLDALTNPRLVRSGGNPNLVPEDGITKQAGLVIDVSTNRVHALSVEATYGQIEQDNLIRGGLGVTFILQNEVSGTGDLVIRAPGSTTFVNTTASPIPILSGPGGVTTPLQPGQSATVPGSIIRINNAALNLAYQQVRYLDFGLRYRFATENLGNFTLIGSWTTYESYFLRRAPSDPNINEVGRSIPRNRGQARLVWDLGRHGANLGMNYLHRYRNLITDGWEVGRYYTFSAGYEYTFADDSFLNGLKLSVGIENLLDRDPPPDLTGAFYNQGFVNRPAGRFGFVSVRQTF